MQKDLYLQEAMRQLNNKKYYEQLGAPIYADTAYKIYLVLNRMRHNGDISANQLAYLKPDLTTITPATFIYCPKSISHSPLGHTHPCRPEGPSSLIAI